MLHMKNIIPYPCVKFGQRKNLEALKNGEVFFSTLKTLINDSTDYRGDPDEGASYIDPSKVDIKVDGKSLFHDLGVPFPSSVRMTHVDDEKVHIFSCCALRKEVWIGTKSLRICDEVKHEMMKFGSYALVFDINELLDNLSEVSSENNIGYIADYVVYKDKPNDYSPVTFSSDSPYNCFFVKDTSYRFQNEYRIVIDGKTQPLKSNRKNGYLLRTKPLTSAHIFESSVLLNTAKIIIEDD